LARDTPLYDPAGRFLWDERREQAAILLAQGYSKKEICEKVEIHESTLWRWEQEDSFSEEVDNLSLMYGLASKAHRTRLLNQAIRQKINNKTGQIDLSGVTFLDLIKEARMQTEGLKLDILNTLIPAFAEETGSVAGSGSDRSTKILEAKAEETK
jgi:transcriptional regulator with XRE-family HTH domain